MSVSCHIRKWSDLFDHLVGGRKQRRRNLQAEDFRGFQVDRQIEFGRLLERKFARSGAIESRLFDHLVPTGEHLSAMVIQAARLAAILLRIARGLRPA